MIILIQGSIANRLEKRQADTLDVATCEYGQRVSKAIRIAVADLYRLGGVKDSIPALARSQFGEHIFPGTREPSLMNPNTKTIASCRKYGLVTLFPS